MWVRAWPSSLSLTKYCMIIERYFVGNLLKQMIGALAIAPLLCSSSCACSCFCSSFRSSNFSSCSSFSCSSPPSSLPCEQSLFPLEGEKRDCLQGTSPRVKRETVSSLGLSYFSAFSSRIEIWSEEEARKTGNSAWWCEKERQTSGESENNEPSNKKVSRLHSVVTAYWFSAYRPLLTTCSCCQICPPGTQ